MLAKYIHLALNHSTENHAETTNDALRSMLNMIVKALAPYQFDKIVHSDIQQVILNWQQEGKSNKTICNYLAPMRKIFKTATLDNVFETNPMEGIKNPKQTREDKEKPPPSIFSHFRLRRLERLSQTIRLVFLARQ